jgi:hypothetical protein
MMSLSPPLRDTPGPHPLVRYPAAGMGRITERGGNEMSQDDPWARHMIDPDNSAADDSLGATKEEIRDSIRDDAGEIADLRAEVTRANERIRVLTEAMDASLELRKENTRLAERNRALTAVRDAVWLWHGSATQFRDRGYEVEMEEAILACPPTEKEAEDASA